jgi:hypothetical protein
VYRVAKQEIEASWKNPAAGDSTFDDLSFDEF